MGALYNAFPHMPLLALRGVESPRPSLVAAIATARQELNAVCRELLAIGMDPDPSPSTPDGDDGTTLDELREQLRAMTLLRDKAVAEMRDNDKIHKSKLLIANMRGTVREQKGRLDAARPRGKPAQPNNPSNPFVYNPPPPLPTYSALVNTHQAYTNTAGATKRCMWKDVPETLTIRTNDPKIEDHSFPAFHLFVGGITSTTSTPFDTTTVKVSERGVPIEKVVPTSNGGVVYQLEPTNWDYQRDTGEWLAKLELTATKDSGSLNRQPVDLELGMRPLQPERFGGMSNGGDVQVKFQTDNDNASNVSVIVRSLEGIVPKVLYEAIINGSKVGYYTKGVYEALSKASKSTPITVDASP